MICTLLEACKSIIEVSKAITNISNTEITHALMKDGTKHVTFRCLG